MTPHSSKPTWIFVRSPEGRWFYRTSVGEGEQLITLPGDVEIKLTRIKSGVRVVSVPGSNHDAIPFAEGSVLLQPKGESVPVLAGRKSLTNLARWAAMVVIVFLLSISSEMSWLPSSKAETSAPVPPAKKQQPMKKKVVKPKVTPTPSPSPTPTPKAISSLKPKRVRLSKAARTSALRIEQEARTYFLQGNLPRAKAALLQAGSGPLPATTRQLQAEIDYAECQRAFFTQKWEEAAVSCQRANSRQGHLKAKKLLERLSAQARKLYLEGYAMERTNPAAAVSRYRAVLAQAPETDPYRQKAEGKLKALKDVRVD